jgi:hypothetical protein
MEIVYNLLNKECYKIIFEICLKICIIKKYDKEAIFYFMKQVENKIKRIYKENFLEIFHENNNLICLLLNEDSMSFEIDKINHNNIDYTNSYNDNNNINSNEKNILGFDEICIESSQKNPFNKIKVIDDESENESLSSLDLKKEDKNRFKENNNGIINDNNEFGINNFYKESDLYSFLDFEEGKIVKINHK